METEENCFLPLWRQCFLVPAVWHSGVTGTYPCLFCLDFKQKMQTESKEPSEKKKNTTILREHVYKDITDILIIKIRQFTDDDGDIIGVAVTTKDMFDTLSSHFACIHSLISKAQPISEETILQAETVSNFTDYAFPIVSFSSSTFKKSTVPILWIGQVLD